TRLQGDWSSDVCSSDLIGGQCDGRCLIGTLNQTVRSAAPIALAAYCGVICERAGVINIGIEGMMLMGAMVGYLVDICAFVAFKEIGRASCRESVERDVD